MSPLVVVLPYLVSIHLGCKNYNLICVTEWLQIYDGNVMESQNADMGNVSPLHARTLSKRLTPLSAPSPVCFFKKHQSRLCFEFSTGWGQLPSLWVASPQGLSVRVPACACRRRTRSRAKFARNTSKVLLVLRLGCLSSSYSLL